MPAKIRRQPISTRLIAKPFHFNYFIYLAYIDFCASVNTFPRREGIATLEPPQGHLRAQNPVLFGGSNLTGRSSVSVGGRIPMSFDSRHGSHDQTSTRTNRRTGRSSASQNWPDRMTIRALPVIPGTRFSWCGSRSTQIRM